MLVALFHATNWLGGIGLPIAGWQLANDMLSTLRMPLFFMLSGLFAAKWLAVSWAQLWHGKLALFAWVFALWSVIGTGTLFLGVATRGEAIGVGGGLRDLLLAPFAPRFELWFIWGLAIFFVLARLLRRVPVAAQLVVAALVSALALTDWVALTGSPWWADLNAGWTGLGKYFVFFLGGLYLRERILSAADRTALLLKIGVVLVWAGLTFLSVPLGVREVPGFAFVTAIAGVAAGVVVSVWLSRLAVLRFLGARTLPIYVTHTPAIIVMLFFLAPVLSSGDPVVLARLAPPLIAAAAIAIGVAIDLMASRGPARFLFTPPIVRNPRGGTMSQPITVQQSFPEPRPTTNPYIVMLRDALEISDGVRVKTFSWRSALLGRYDVFHVHWPEILPRGSTPLRSLARQALSAALLVRLSLRGTPVVRTMHNLERPQGISRREGWIIGGIERRTRLTIALNEHTPPAGDVPSVTIVHGHYRDWYAPCVRSEPVPGRVAYVGLIRRYKGVDTLMDAFRELPGDDLSLHVAGKPSTPEMHDELSERAARDRRVTLTPRFLSDADLVTQVTEAELVVLPYTAMHNSGGVLAALSLDRPVLVPDTAVNAELAAEVGEGWVFRYSGELGAADIDAALRGARAPGRSDRPDLSRRGWVDAGAQYRDAYLRAVGAGPDGASAVVSSAGERRA